MIGYSRAFNELYGPKPIEGKKMNERIKELAVQAEKMVEHSWGDPNYRDDDYNRAFDEWQEKFAELIVRECAGIAKQTDTDDGDDYKSGRVWAGIDILKHFNVGVES